MSERGFGADYDTIVRWEKRLARETPLFERLFRKHDVHSVADVGCGTGQHAIVFARWGLVVWGLDPSEEMLERARRSAQEAGVDVTFAAAGFGDVADAVGVVDAVVSLGNALPHVPDIDGLRVAFRDFANALRPGGVLVLHLLNHDRLDEQDVRMLPPVFRETEDGDTIVFKVIDHESDHYVFEFTGLTREKRAAGMDDAEPSAWSVEPRRSRHTKLLGDTVRDELTAAGFIDLQALGDHAGRALDVTTDESVIWVATKG